MKTFILVHGAWHSSWYWSEVVTVLTNAGHHVVAQDLPGHSLDDFRPDLMNLPAYVTAVSEQVKEMPGKVTLVGHSMGGLVISQVAEFLPEKIEKLIYVAGFILEPGETLLGILKEQLVQSKIESPFKFTEDRKEIFLPGEIARTIFYHDCSEEIACSAIKKLKNQSILPFITPIQLTAERFGRVETMYLECSLDRAVFPLTQEKMLKHTACTQVIKLNAGHFPMLSIPHELSRNILRL